MRDRDHRTLETATIACDLSAADFARRREEIGRDLFGHVDRVQELADGFAYHFPSADPWAAAVFAFVDAERRCCPFFAFEVAFEPDDGPLWLRLRGSAEIKAFVRAELDGIAPGAGQEGRR